MNIFSKTICFLFCAIFCFLFAISTQGQSSETEIILSWSTDTYTPLGYRGKALLSQKSSVEVVANVFSQEVNPREITYQWFLDGREQKNASGEGRQIFEFKMGEGSTQKSVGLQIRNKDGLALRQPLNLILKPQKPEVVLKTNALLLEYFGNIPKYQVSSDKKINFTAQSYFFNIKSIEELSYQWEIGGEKAIQTDENNPNMFILKVGQLTNSFTRNMSIKTENKNNPLQKARLTVEISFKP